MGSWHRSWKADLGLRAVGLACCALGYAAIAQLFASLLPAVSPPDLSAFALAAGGFLSASIGVAMTIWGKHLFDHVTVSARWRRSTALPARRTTALAHVRHAERAVMASADAGSGLADHAVAALTRSIERRG